MVDLLNRIHVYQGNSGNQSTTPQRDAHDQHRYRYNMNNRWQVTKCNNNSRVQLPLQLFLEGYQLPPTFLLPYYSVCSCQQEWKTGVINRDFCFWPTIQNIFCICIQWQLAQVKVKQEQQALRNHFRNSIVRHTLIKAPTSIFGPIVQLR